MPIYVPPRGSPDAKIMIVGEAPGYDEVRAGKPFVGYSGMEMARMLNEAGILEHECFITNVLRFQPPGNDELYYISPKKKDAPGRAIWNNRYLRQEIRSHIDDLEKEVEAVQPNVIIAFGDLALWALTGESGIIKWRGSVLQSQWGPKVVPTLHPAAVQRMWPFRPVVIHDLKRAAEESKTPDLYIPDYKFILRPTYELAAGFLTELLGVLNKSGGLHISCDIETRAKQIACLGLAISATCAICIPFMCLERKGGYWSLEEEIELIKLIRSVLTHPNAQISGQNFLYDAQYLVKCWGFTPRIWRDTMVLQHVLFPDLPRILKPKSLGFLATFYCEHPRFWKDEGKNWDSSIPEDVLWNYNCKDGVNTWEIAEAMEGLPAKMGVEYPAKFQMQLWWPVLKIMLRGIRQDLGERIRLRVEMRQYMEQLQKRIDCIAGHSLNTRSAPQLKSFFYRDLGIKPIFKRKTGAETLDDEALETIARREPLLKPFITLIQHHRSAGVYASNFLEMESDTDGRMRSSINIAHARTFRFATSRDAFGSGGNLQNPPRNNIARSVYEAGGRCTYSLLADILGTTEAKAKKEAQESIDDGYLREENGALVCDFAMPNIRKLFIPDSGYTIGEIDLDRADLQVVVWEAGDAEMKQMLREGVDIHAENAKIVGLSRYDSKIFVHATNYGASPRKLAPLFRKSVHEMDVAQKRWFGARPGILRWHKRTAAGLPKAQNKFGYKIHFLDRLDSLLPKALAWVPQSTVAVVINHALLRISEQLPNVQILLQVHDSLVFQIKTELVATELPKMLELAKVVIPYDDPLIIPLSAKTSTKSWGDCKEWISQ